MSTIEDRLKIVMGNLSGREFAAKLGKSSTTVNQYLNGRTPPVDFIVLVCERFNVDSWWLLTGEGKGPEERKASPVVKMIDQVLEGMDEETQREVLKYTEEKKLLGRLKKLVLDKEAGWVALNLLTMMVFPTLIILALVAYHLLSGPSALELLRQQPKWAFSFMACIAQNPIAFIELARRRSMSWKAFQ